MFGTKVQQLLQYGSGLARQMGQIDWQPGRMRPGDNVFADEDSEDETVQKIDDIQLVRHDKSKRIEGVKLDERQSQYLQPHFFSVIIGKPGAGKSTLIEKLINEKEFYSGKFNRVLVVSPSVHKMDLQIRKSNKAEVFDIEWIFKKIHQLNEKQMQWIQRFRDQQDSVIDPGITYSKLTKAVLYGTAVNPPSMYLQNRFMKGMQMHNSPYLAQISRSIKGHGSMGSGIYDTPAPMFKVSSIDKPTKRRIVKRQTKEGIKLEEKVGQIQEYANSINEMFKKYVDDDTSNQRHLNMLIVLDDVVSDIKELEQNAAMTKLFLNRRHLLANGTISIILGSQKYTLIPSRLRTNANQVISFRLNPKDMEVLKEDQVDVPDELWREITGSVFGNDTSLLNQKPTSSKDSHGNHSFVNIWTDKRKIFNGFEQIF